MKSFNTILFITCIYSSAYSQNLNNTDDRGLKQGHWEIYETDSVIPRPVISIELKKSNVDNTIENEKPGMKEYNVDFIIAAEGQFVNNKKQLNWKYYNTENAFQPLRYNSSRVYFKGDSAIFHKHYCKGSLIKEIEYLSDSINGYYKSYHKNGNLKSTIKYKMGMLTDSVICYYESGKAYYSGKLLPGMGFYEGTEYYESGGKRAVKKFAANYILSKWVNK